MLSVGQNISVLKHPPVRLDDQGWEEMIEKIPGILRFDRHTLPYLSTLLKRFQSCDPYMTCPAYHAFTGRNGLWGYARGKSLVLFCRHPNKPRQILFFPQLGRPFPNLALELIETINRPEDDYAFARYPEEQAAFMAASMTRQSRYFSFHSKMEDVLDWAYPVHTLSTAMVIEAHGKNFKSFRNDLHQIDPNHVLVEMIDPHADVNEIMSIAKSWAQGREYDLRPDELVDFYKSFLQLMKCPSLNLAGVKFYYRGKLIAFEAWDMPMLGKDTANNLAGLNIAQDEGIRGFSSYQHYTICKILKKAGIDYICLGGSETEGLDNFKRKMNPVRSVELKSIAVTPRTQSLAEAAE